MTADRRRLARALTVAALAVPLLLAGAGQASAETNPSCTTAEQIGGTGYLKIGSATFASVKQFAGCGRNWGYAYVWKSWRDAHPAWTVCAAVLAGSPGDVQGLRCGTGRTEIWSYGTATLDQCTRAIVTPRPPADGVPVGYTDQRC